MDTTPNLALPYILPGQAQKHVTHNEAIRALDAIIHLSVASRVRAAPPTSPQDGERYLITSGASGDWAGHDGKLAAFQDGAWQFWLPQQGWVAFIADEAAAFLFDGSAWTALKGEALPASVNPAPLVGINTTADATNRLALKSDAALFSHDDVTPGSGDMRLLLNKSGPGRTGSLLYQSGWSGRAEIGLTGADDLRIKVSADGATWNDALVVDAATGRVDLPATPVAATPFNLLKDGGRFAGSPEPQSSTALGFIAPSYIIPVADTVIAAGPKFIFNNTTHGGTSGVLDPEINALVSRLRDATNPAYRRYGVEFHTLRITAGANTLYPLSFGAAQQYLLFTNPSVPIADRLTFNLHVRVLSGSVGLNHRPETSELFIDGVQAAGDIVLTEASGWAQVTRRLVVNPRRFVGYDNNLARIYAQPGSELLLAAPVISPGHVPMAPGRLFGIIPSLEAWR